MGEEKKEEEKKVEDTEEKKKEEPPEIVLKVDMHCEACARKVARTLKGFEGVEEVKTDSKSSKVVVKGKGLDSVKVSERLQKKSGRKVELISPLPKPKEDSPKEEEKKEEPPKEEEKKEEPPQPVTVVLNVRMHCEACAQVLQKRIKKIKGVDSVETDVANDKVTVKGILEHEKLINDIYKKTKKQASVVKKEEEKKEKKEDEKKDGKEEKKNGEEGKEEDDKKTEMKRSEYWPSMSSMEHSYYPPPQMFSDENPNACSVM